MKPVIISYFTRGTLYEKDAADLQASCDRLGLESSIDGIDSFGSWDSHCCFKPGFILRKLKKLKKPVVWIDADALVIKSPDLFDSLTCDLAVRIDPEREPSDFSKVRTGTVFVNYTKAGMDLVKDWGEICQEALKSKPKGHEVWDQICLKALIQQGTQAKIESLPNSYCAIFDAQEDQENPVIVHYAASRLYKKFINGEVASFLEELSIEQLRALRPNIQY
ncbi:MAG: hypothetical protein JSS32_02400 [Verrucomicrobia bacterium]|nr:hypothetical protein [Verrucomicrobiota bacterium]